MCQRRTSHDGRIMKYFDEDYWEELRDGCRWDVAAEPQGALHRIRRCWLHNSCVTVSQWTTCSVDLPCAGSAGEARFGSTARPFETRPRLYVTLEVVGDVLFRQSCTSPVVLIVCGMCHKVLESVPCQTATLDKCVPMRKVSACGAELRTLHVFPIRFSSAATERRIRAASAVSIRAEQYMVTASAPRHPNCKGDLRAGSSQKPPQAICDRPNSGTIAVSSDT